MGSNKLGASLQKQVCIVKLTYSARIQAPKKCEVQLGMVIKKWQFMGLTVRLQDFSYKNNLGEVNEKEEKPLRLEKCFILVVTWFQITIRAIQDKIKQAVHGGWMENPGTRTEQCEYVMENLTYTKDFHLVPFSAKSDYTSLFVNMFFFLYLFGVITNSMIITVTCTNDQLHTPMYLFLCNLALVDICYTTTTVPNLLYMLFSGDNTVFFLQCFTQMYFYAVAASTENVLILIMAFDRYVAICHPLHYHDILNRKHCLLLASGTWITGFLNSFVMTIPVSNMSFCQSHTVYQFFCDAKSLINISCAGTEYFSIVIYLEILVVAFFPVTFSLISYIKIIRVILQIKSKDGRKKAFSTCSSHLTIVIIYYTTGMSVYMMPSSESFNVLNQVLTVIYTVVTPIINPLIYSLRNKDVKIALLRLLGGNITW
ncbi:olfactory receptor 1M1-like [Pseudophryne corroboree]|uniref:olfactory receptor 1M1-like n=1 Tax=Pseudophryne corroboree TaxID=495146 RepID=UPI003081F4FE